MRFFMFFSPIWIDWAIAPEWFPESAIYDQSLSPITLD